MLNQQIPTNDDLGFLAPRQVLSGRGASSRVADALRMWGIPAGPVLVVADRVVSDAGLLDALLASLGAAGWDAVVFDEVSGEPTAELVLRAAAMAREAGATAVVGVGGGSAMDSAKVAALLATNSGSPSDWLGVIEPPRPLPPLVLIPTTTGTGAETTRIAMITVAGAKRVVSCAQFVPLVAVLDEKLVDKLPATVVASTGMDALAHAVESMLSTNRSTYTLAMGTRAAELLVANLATAVLDGNPIARGRTMYASHLAGLALNAGVVVGHSLAYVVAKYAPMPHGTSCALALPFCLAYNRGITGPLSEHIAQTVTGNDSSELQVAAERISQLTERVGLPTSLDQVGILAEGLLAMAAETIQDYPRPNNPAAMDHERLHQLLSAMHAGNVSAAWELDIPGSAA